MIDIPKNIKEILSNESYVESSKECIENPLSSLIIEKRNYLMK
jgi:hypothetical protein